MEAGNYRWERKQGFNTEVVQTDAASPYQIAEHFSPISSNSHSKVDIVIENDPKITVYLWNKEGRLKEIDIKNNQISIPENKGRYIYEVVGQWDNGEVSYTFVVNIND
ncbi:MAG TPA: hypothetical protein VNM69_20560 [Bacillus sp. (in: firmicutes)]|nr:hypothetical protein [Bacillus litorisediminis]HWO78265.1 hypothetical protein [Bacillus sp. (in: firmicutes)]